MAAATAHGPPTPATSGAGSEVAPWPNYLTVEGLHNVAGTGNVDRHDPPVVHVLPSDTQEMVAACSSSALPLHVRISDRLKEKIWAGEYVDLALSVQPVHVSSTTGGVIVGETLVASRTNVTVVTVPTRCSVAGLLRSDTFPVPDLRPILLPDCHVPLVRPFGLGSRIPSPVCPIALASVLRGYNDNLVFHILFMDLPDRLCGCAATAYFCDT